MAEYSRVFLGMRGGRKGEATLMANTMKIQDTLGYCYKNGGAMLRFGLSMLLLSPTAGSPGSFRSSRDTTQVQATDSWGLQHPDFCLTAVWHVCARKTKPTKTPSRRILLVFAFLFLKHHFDHC